MMKLIVAFRNFENTPKNSSQSKYGRIYKDKFLMIMHVASRWTGKQMSSYGVNVGHRISGDECTDKRNYW